MASPHALARAATGMADRDKLLAALKQLQEQAGMEHYQHKERPSAYAPPAAAAPASRPPSARHVQVQVFLHQMNELASAGDTEALIDAAQEFRATQQPWQSADLVVAASLSHATRRLLKVGCASWQRSFPTSAAAWRCSTKHLARS